MTRSNLMRLNAAVEREIRGVKMRRDRVRLEEQFRQAQKMEAVGRLAGGVAHDFNNLLTVITGYSDLLLAGTGLNAPQRTALEEIRRSAERGGGLTQQLLSFSRRQPLESRAIRTNDLVLQMEKMLHRLIGENIEMVTAAIAVSDLVIADRGRLEQVIMNLVVNARDAMPKGGKLTIETATMRLHESFSAGRLGVAPAPTSRFRSPIREPAWIRKHKATSSNRSHHQAPRARHWFGTGDRIRHHPAERRRDWH